MHLLLSPAPKTSADVYYKIVISGQKNILLYLLLGIGELAILNVITV